MHSIFRSSLSVFLKLIASTTLFFTASELGVRLLGIAPKISSDFLYTTRDKFLPWKPQPNSTLIGGFGPGEYRFTHQHNSMGFRDIEHDTLKKPGVIRIMAVGDSFTYGAGARAEDTYPSVLGKLLNEQTSKPVEIINTGISRFFPEPEQALIEHYGTLYKPDLILVGFVSNDVPDTAMGIESVVVDESGSMTSREAKILGKPGKLLYMHSHLFRTLWDLFVSQRIAFQSNVDRSEIYKENGRYEKDWQKIEAIYGRILEHCRLLNTRLVVVHLADKEAWKDQKNYIPNRLKKWADNNQVQFIDTLPELKKAGTTSSLYWKIDGHPNAAGYQAMATTIARELSEIIKNFN